MKTIFRFSDQFLWAHCDHWDFYITLSLSSLNNSLQFHCSVLVSYCIFSSVFTSACRSKKNDGWLCGHGRVHHSFWLDHWSAGMLPAAWPHAICSWATLSHGRYCESTYAHIHTQTCRQNPILFNFCIRSVTAESIFGLTWDSRSMSSSNMIPVPQ